MTNKIPERQTNRKSEKKVRYNENQKKTNKQKRI